MAKKKAAKKHHPDYEPDIECGSLYMQKEVALEMMHAIIYKLKHDKSMTDLDAQRLRVSAQVVNDVFDIYPPQYAAAMGWVPPLKKRGGK
jgi:hypothetical protein